MPTIALTSSVDAGKATAVRRRAGMVGLVAAVLLADRAWRW